MLTMPIVDLYSKRQKRLRGEVPDVLTYDKIPQILRVQIIHIWDDFINYDDTFYGDAYDHYLQMVEVK